MPSRRYKERDSSDFIHVDLLPEVKRPRQFNVNVVFIVLATVILTWLIIYIPLSSRQETLDTVLERNNELTDERDSLRGIINEHRIEADRVALAESIDDIKALQQGYNVYIDDFENAIVFTDSSGYLTSFRYNAVAGEIVFTVVYRIPIEAYNPFRDLEFELLSLDYVENVSRSPRSQIAPGSTRYSSRFTLEVSRLAE